MFDSFRKGRLALLTALLLTPMGGFLTANEDAAAGKNATARKDATTSVDSCSCNRLYFGIFGGGIYSNSSKASQMGTALFSEDEGGPLAVEARGHVKKNGTGFGGVQFGYEWSKCMSNTCSSWAIAPAAEIEGYWLQP